MKKFIFVSLLLTFVMALAACGGGTQAPAGGGAAPARPETPAAGTGAATPAAPAAPVAGDWQLGPENPMEISMLIVTNQTEPAPNNRIANLMQERLGVTITYEIVSPDLQAQRIGLMLTSGILPDIIGSGEVEARLTEGGALLRLDDYIDGGQFPNILEHVSPYRRRLSWAGGGVPDGLYTLPNYNRFYGNPPILGGTHWGSGFFIQKSVLEYHGFPSLDNMTLERYFDLIEGYMQSNPTIDGMPTIGFSFPAFPGQVWGMTNPPLFLAGHPNHGGFYIVNGVAHRYDTSQYAEDYFRFLNQAFLRGLVDPETFTLTQDQFLANMATGRVLGVHSQRWAFGTAHDSLVSRGEYDRTMVATMPVFPGRTPWYADRDVMNIHQGWAVASTTEHPERILAFIDAILSEEWQILLSWGEEGIDYHVDADGFFYRTPEQRAEQNDLTWRASNRLMAFVDQMPKRQGTLSCGNAWGPGDQPSEFLAGLSDYDRSFLEAYGKRTWRDFLNDPPDNPVYYPAWSISLGPGSPADIANQQLEDAAVQFLPGIIMAPEGQFDARWAEYVAHIGLIDIVTLEATMTAGIQDRIARWGQ